MVGAPDAPGAADSAGGSVSEPERTTAAEASAPERRRPAVLRSAAQRTRQVHQSRTFDVIVGVGLVTYGFVHLLIAGIAVRIAWTGVRGSDTQDAALAAMAQTVFGEVLRWITAFGLAALTLWQLFEAIWRRNPLERAVGKAFGRTGALFSAAAYLTLGISAARVALAGRAAREGRRTIDTTTAFEEAVLRVAVVITGIVLVVLAVRAIYRGVRRRFLEDLKDGAHPAVIIVGQGGYIGKGITFGIVGALMIIVGIDGRTGPPGLETVFRLLNLSPAGGILLLLKAFGLALFGVYCFAWAANRRR